MFKSFFSIFSICVFSCFSQSTEQIISAGGSMELSSTAFKPGGMIPAKYTCDGSNISPPLKWSAIPPETKTFALICEDPDAPAGLWVHWLIYNLPGDVNELTENIPALEILPSGARQGQNDFGRIGYGGPCPPRGIHRYFFRLYALDEVLMPGAGVSRSGLLKAMEGHVLSEGQLIGKYQR
jgi:Raf kinase inhibitor-like YbhB/YbcL family protein